MNDDSRLSPHLTGVKYSNLIYTHTKYGKLHGNGEKLLTFSRVTYSHFLVGYMDVIQFFSSFSCNVTANKKLEVEYRK